MNTGATIHNGRHRADQTLMAMQEMERLHGGEQPAGDARPRPAVDDRLPGGMAAARRGRLEKVLAPHSACGRRSVALPVSKDARWRKRSGYSSSSPAATSASPECRATSGGDPAAAASAATIPNALGEDRRHHRDVCERQQVPEMTVLERPREQRARRASDSSVERDGRTRRQRAGHRFHASPRSALARLSPRSASRSKRRAARARRETRQGAARCRRRAGARRRRSVDLCGPPRASPRALGHGPAERTLDVHAGRNVEHAVSVANHVCEHCANVLGANVGRVRARKSFPRPLAQLGAPSHRGLELGAVCLDAKGGAAGRSDGPAHQHVVGEHEIGRQQRADRSRVRFDVRASLGLAEVLEELRLEPLVPIHDEHGQQPTRKIDGNRLRAGEVVLLRRAFLRDDDDLVSPAAPLTRERAGVDIRPGSSEEVTVPEQDAHR